MSEYNTIQAKPLFNEHYSSPHGFFGRYCHQLCDIFTTGLDFKTIWSQFCGVANINAKKPCYISNEKLKELNELTDHEIYVLIGKAIGRFWKGDYKGEGF